jgi:hypothetical protein
LRPTDECNVQRSVAELHMHVGVRRLPRSGKGGDSKPGWYWITIYLYYSWLNPFRERALKLKIMNISFAASVKQSDVFSRGFKLIKDGTNDVRGESYDYENEKFILSIDSFYDVYLIRKTNSSTTDAIQLKVDSIQDIDAIIDWIND